MDFKIEETLPTVFSGHSSEKEEQFLLACEWMESLGINYTRTRFGEYKKDFALFFNPNRKNIPTDDLELANEFYVFMQAQMEVVQLIRLMNTYQDKACEGFLNTFKKTMSGRKLRREAINATQDPARDFAFELSVASRFIKGGFTVDLSDRADLVVDINGKKLFVECKRIRSEKKLKPRVNHANTQIEKRLKKCVSNKPRGVVALDLTDIINPMSSIVVYSDIKEFYRASVDTIEEYVIKKSEILKSKYDKRCLGILCEKTSIGFLIGEEAPVIGHARSATFLNYGDNRNNKEFVDEFLPKIGNQNI
ncbi:hypothetical protein MNBD_GAMMA18-582 [hydrothermal vent metagenome]|uniref:Uncharacterized protein n=1 Tax=hydrothermal vent metagenome TaxID=652676 RepID=A0A3B0ZRP3_9ZZZZ